MEKDKTLSEKERSYADEPEYDYFYKKDVKQFIKEILEDIDLIQFDNATQLICKKWKVRKIIKQKAGFDTIKRSIK